MEAKKYVCPNKRCRSINTRVAIAKIEAEALMETDGTPWMVRSNTIKVIGPVFIQCADCLRYFEPKNAGRVKESVPNETMDRT